MLLAVLICTDADCAVHHEACGTPEELEGLACELCGCTLQAIGWAEVTPNGAGLAPAYAQLLDAA